MAPPALLIVGAGPTGLAAAVELARRGIPARIIDRKTDPLPLSRAVGINARSLALLAPSGVTERLLAEGIRVRRARIHDGARLVCELRLDWQSFTYDFILALPQDRTEAILLARLRELGGAVEFGVGLDALTLGPEGAVARLGHGADGRIETARFDLVLGADGVRSGVRAAAGLAFEGFELPAPWGVADVDAPAWPHREAFSLFMLPAGGVAVVVPIGPERYRVVANRPGALAQVPGGLEAARIRREAEFRIAVKQVARYSAGPVYLAGDAAHCHSPAGGRGMNLGLADAAAFARHLAEGTLPAYGAERRPQGAAAIRFSERLRRGVTSQNPAARRILRWGLGLLGQAPGLQKRLARRLLDA